MKQRWVVGFDADTHHLGCCIGRSLENPSDWEAKTFRLNGNGGALFTRISQVISLADMFLGPLEKENPLVIIEMPEVQGVHKIKALIPLAFLVGALWDHLSGDFEVELISPNEWKFRIPKETFQYRFEKYYPKLFKHLQAQSADHHALDAAGLISYKLSGKKLGA